MHLCINCGSDKVERQGDNFTCHKCQFQWDVAFEQANKTYLRSQGRQPAQSSVETATEKGLLTTTLGQVGTLPPSEPTIPPASDEPPSDVVTVAETSTGDREQSPFAAPTPKPSGKNKANS